MIGLIVEIVVTIAIGSGLVTIVGIGVLHWVLTKKKNK